MLADHGTQTHRQLRAQFGLHVCRDEIDVAGEGSLGVAGVQRGEHQVSRLRRAQHHLGRVAITDLADQDHVGILSQSVFQSLGERGDVAPNLALRHDRPLVVGKDVFDRLFERDDPIIALLGEPLDQHGQRGGFAGARHA